MEWWQAVVLGLVEGITEYLPVSSTGHLILASALVGLDDPARKHAVDSLNIVIQGGAILAVVGMYWPRMKKMLLGLFGRSDSGLRLLLNLFLGFFPSAALGFVLHDHIEAALFHPGPVIAMLALGGVYMIVVDAWRSGRFGLPAPRSRQIEIEDVTPVQALLIGVLQCVALWPGTSRSLMTITGGLFIGLRPRAAAEFSFLLGLPTLTGACVYAMVKDLRRSAELEQPNFIATLGVFPVLLSLAVATVSAALAVKWLVGFLNKRGLAPFGWYRLVLCVVFAVLTSLGVIQFTA
ncbi:MAG: undecaprenyl-diphosphate phosphatase [Planctomycetota bacterium]|nr:undecaprenyl-diphosphate phosphatase [Planctomycetota bacterium]